MGQQMMYGVSEIPLRSVEDIRGAKIATTPGIGAQAFGSITGGVVAGPAVRFFELVSKGMVDGYLNLTPIEVFSFNLSNYTRNAVQMGEVGAAGPFVLVINERKWRNLTDDQRKVFEDLSGEAFSRRMAALDAAIAEAATRMKEAGIDFEQISPDLESDLKSAFGFIEKNWYSRMNDLGIDGLEAMDFYRQTMTSIAADDG